MSGRYETDAWKLPLDYKEMYVKLFTGNISKKQFPASLRGRWCNKESGDRF